MIYFDRIEVVNMLAVSSGNGDSYKLQVMTQSCYNLHCIHT